MVVTFTGTQKGMTEEQKDKLEGTLYLLTQLWGEEVEFHHGDCIGADAEAAEMAKSLNFTLYCHPAKGVGKKRANTTFNDVEYRELPPLDRNKVMVALADVVIAAPFEATEILRSGTWSTIRYARKKNILVIIL